MHYYADNLIIGAGIAGTVFGSLMLQNGIENTLIIDIASLVKKDKLCGGIISDRTVQIIENALTQYKLPEHKVNYRSEIIIDGNTLLKEKIWHSIKRKDLDISLIEKYLSCGGKILQNHLITSINQNDKIISGINKSDESSFTCEYKNLIAADGANSYVRKQITGRRQNSIITLEATIDGIPQYNLPKIFINEKIKGYSWYIPYIDQAVYGCLSFDKSLQDILQLRKEMNFIEIQLDLTKTKYRGALIPFGNDVLLQDKNIYFLGDAAGLIDPVKGGGIRLAIQSAVNLADSLIKGEDYVNKMQDIIKEQETFYGLMQSESYTKLW